MAKGKKSKRTSVEVSTKLAKKQKPLREHLVSTVCEVHRSRYKYGLSGQEITSIVFTTLLEIDKLEIEEVKQ